MKALVRPRDFAGFRCLRPPKCNDEWQGLPKAWIWDMGSQPKVATAKELERANFSTDYTKHVDNAPAPSAMLRISPRVVDAILAGAALAFSTCLLHGIDRALGDFAPPFFAPPLMPSGLLFFAGPVPPPAKAFLWCSLIAYIFGIAVYFSGPEDTAFKVASAGGLLLTLFKTTNNFFVPTLGLAIGMISDPFHLLASPLTALKFLACPWLLGHGMLYAMALAFANLRRQVRMYLMRSKLRANFAHLGDSELTHVFHRYDTSGDGFLQAGELRFAWQAATGELMTEEDADALVRSIDTDGNGEVDVDEFITLIRDAM